ncbi:MAG: hypothetical protein LBK52_01820 [Deltaproteobacteria bacterium]|jgi:hypothetical protein|nr:hypothetical protein [Deltaproteobacteria bacterium]
MGKLRILLCLLVWSWGGEGLALENSYIWWQLISQDQAPDGGHLLQYTLQVSRPAELEELEVICRFSPYHREGAVRGYGPGTVYRKMASPRQREFVFYSGSAGRLEIFAQARSGGRTFLAQTMAAAFGQSGTQDPEGELLDGPPAWPQWTLEGGDRFYRTQAGQLLEVSLAEKPALVRIWEDGVSMASLPGREAGRYQYRSPASTALSQSGYTALKKDTVFTAYIDDHRTMTFSLPVYRAYYGQLDYSGGLIVLGTVLAGTCGLAGIRGRRLAGS